MVAFFVKFITGFLILTGLVYDDLDEPIPFG